MNTSKSEQQLKALEQMKEMKGIFEFIATVGEMRHYQKAFFKERGSPKLKQEYLDKSKALEKEVDSMLKTYQPSTPETNQLKIL